MDKFSPKSKISGEMLTHGFTMQFNLLTFQIHYIMAFSKAHLYPADLQITCAKLKAIAYPARLDILFFLLVNGPCCVQEIAKHHPISQEALSGHLAILREGHLVCFDERYPYTFYRLDHTNLHHAIALIRSILDRFDDPRIY